MGAANTKTSKLIYLSRDSFSNAASC